MFLIKQYINHDDEKNPAIFPLHRQTLSRLDSYLMKLMYLRILMRKACQTDIESIDIAKLSAAAVII
jgi:hypothetical protein